MMMFPPIIFSIEDTDDYIFMEQLYMEYGKLMMRCALRVLRDSQDASDAVSQALVSLIDHLQGIRQIECGKLRPYIVSTVRNVSINLAVKRKRENMYAFSADEDVLRRIPSESPLVEDVALGDYRKDVLVRAIKQLSASERAIIDMKYLSKATDKEIGRILSLSPSSVRVYLTRARRRLYETMKGQINEEET